MRRETLLTITICLVVGLTFGCNSKGTRLEYDGNELYYTKRVTEAEAKKLGEYLFNGAAYGRKDKGTIQLDKSGETYQVRMVIKKGEDKEENVEETVAGFAKGISRHVFNGAKVDVQLCDDKLNTLRTIQMGE